MNLIGTPKMKITAYSDSGFSQKSGEMFVQINPNTYTLNYEIQYAGTQTPGTSGQELLFNRIKPQQLNFEFLFDRTGAIPDQGLLPIVGNLGLPLGGKPPTVQDDIDLLKKLTLGYDGTIHRTQFLTLSWGKLLFKCCLTKLDVTYKLFKPDGTPLRANANCHFTEYRETELRVREENKNSPDLTHIRTVQPGDTLPLMAFRIYGDSKYYLQVAKVNEIENFRNLQVGQKIFFPPVEK